MAIEPETIEPEPPETAAQPPPQSSLGRTILRNSIFVSSGGGVVRLLTFLFTIYVVRRLGEVAYGQYLTALALTGMLSILFELGTTQYFERNVAQVRTRLNEMIGDVIGIRLSLAGIGMVVVTTLAILLGYDRTIVFAVLILTFSYISAALLYPLQAVFTSHERYDLWTSTLILGQMLTLVLGSAVLWLGGGLIWLLTTGMIVMPIQIGYCLYLIRRAEIGPLDLRPRLQRALPLIKASLPFALSALALTISFNVDTFFLSLMQESAVVGWYGAAYRLVPTIVSILGGFLTVITPSLARAYITEGTKVGGWVATSTKWLALFGLPAAAGLSMLAAPIVLLLYGEAFAPAAGVLAILAWDIPFRLYNAFSGNVSNAINLENRSWRIFMTGAVIGIIAYLPAIYYYGMYGAAVVTVLSDSITTMLFLWLMHKNLNSVRLGVLARVALAAALMALALTFFKSYTPLVVAVLGGVVVYALLCLLFRLVDQATLRRLYTLVGARSNAQSSARRSA